jgi:hypothetical protein
VATRWPIREAGRCSRQLRQADGSRWRRLHSDESRINAGVWYRRGPLCSAPQQRPRAGRSRKGKYNTHSRPSVCFRVYPGAPDDGRILPRRRYTAVGARIIRARQGDEDAPPATQLAITRVSGASPACILVRSAHMQSPASQLAIVRSRAPAPSSPRVIVCPSAI